MIQHEKRYREFIESRGVGDNDQVASSVDSYVSYLTGVSRLLQMPISPELLHSEEDIERIVAQLRGRRAPATIGNYTTAMRHYVAMVIEAGLWQATPASIR